MKLYLVRHAIAESLANGKYKTDAERPLTEEGFEQAQLVADALAKLGVKLDLVISSPYLRARQTAEKFAEKFDCKLETTGKLAPGVSPDSVFKSLEAFKELEEIMLVGHEPDMGELVSALIGGDKLFRMPFKKAAVACADNVDIPLAFPANLVWLLTPHMITSLS